MKRLISLVICLLLLGSFAAAYASEGNGLQVLDYRTTEKALEVVVYAKADSAVSEKDFTVKLGNSELPVSAVSSYGKGEADGTSWIVVLEPTVYPNNARTMVRALVEDLAANLGNNDRLAVYNSLTGENTEFLSSSASIMPAVDNALKESYGQIKLYDAISSGLTKFKTDPELSGHKCLVVISKGTDTGSSYTFREVYDAASELPITVYAIGVTGQDSSRINAFKELGSLGRATESGFSATANQYTAEVGGSLARQIRENEKNVYTLTALFDEMPEGLPDAETTLNVTLQKDGFVLNARMEQVDGAKIASAAKTETEEEQEAACEHEWEEATCTEPKTCKLCGETEGEALGHDFSKATFFKAGKCSRCDETEPSGLEDLIKEKPIIVGMGALLLLLLLVLLVVLIKKHGKKPVDTVITDDGVKGWTDGNGWGGETGAGGETGSVGFVDEPGGETMLVRPRVTVELTEKKSGKKYTGPIRDTSIKAGLQSEMKLEGDPSISRKHMEFIWQNGILYVQDINSKNGTWVNGEKIDKAVPLHHNDIIHAGETDFIVNWYSN